MSAAQAHLHYCLVCEFLKIKGRDALSKNHWITWFLGFRSEDFSLADGTLKLDDDMLSWCRTMSNHHGDSVEDGSQPIIQIQLHPSGWFKSTMFEFLINNRSTIWGQSSGVSFFTCKTKTRALLVSIFAGGWKIGGLQ